MSIIFEMEYSLACLIFIWFSKRSNMIGKEREIRLENMDSQL